MGNKTINLPIEKWDRIIELLEFVNHPDKEGLLTDINTQLHYSPADEFYSKTYDYNEAKRTMKIRNTLVNIYLNNIKP